MIEEKEKMYLKDDVATKIFTSEECFNYTASVISATLGVDFQYIKNNLKLLDPKIAQNIHNKGTVVDAVYTHDKFLINIEINYNSYEEGLVKNTLYIAQLLLRQTKPGDTYLKTNMVIQININAFDIYGEGDFIYKSYTMDEKYHKRREKLVDIYDINVDYLTNLGYNDVKDLKEEDLRYLLYIFVCSDEMIRKRLYKENPYMNEVFNKMEDLTQEFDGVLYYNRKEFLETISYNHGKDDGRAEGIEVGKVEGAKEKQLEIAKNILENTDLSLEIISKTTGLSLEEIQRLQKETKD